jgi:hypothetical protein
MSALHSYKCEAQKVGSSILPARMHHFFDFYIHFLISNPRLMRCDLALRNSDILNFITMVRVILYNSHSTRFPNSSFYVIWHPEYRNADINVLLSSKRRPMLTHLIPTPNFYLNASSRLRLRHSTTLHTPPLHRPPRPQRFPLRSLTLHQAHRRSMKRRRSSKARCRALRAITFLNFLRRIVVVGLHRRTGKKNVSSVFDFRFTALRFAGHRSVVQLVARQRERVRESYRWKLNV